MNTHLAFSLITYSKVTHGQRMPHCYQLRRLSASVGTESSARGDYKALMCLLVCRTRLFPCKISCALSSGRHAWSVPLRTLGSLGSVRWHTLCMLPPTSVARIGIGLGTSACPPPAWSTMPPISQDECADSPERESPKTLTTPPALRQSTATPPPRVVFATAVHHNTAVAARQRNDAATDTSDLGACAQFTRIHLMT